MKPVLLLILAPLLLAGCSLRINEPEPSAKSFPVQTQGTGCLNNAGPVFERFFDGKADETEINAFWACANDSVELFLKNTTASRAESYSPTELSSFLTKYFLDGKPIPPGLLEQAMRLKKGLIGGETNRITRNEFRRIMGLFQVLQEQQLKLRSVMPVSVESILTRSRDNEEEFERILRTFEQAMHAVGKGLEGSIGTYTLSDLNSLVRELRGFLGGAEWLDRAEKLSGITGPVKAIFIAPPATELGPRDWPRFFYLVPRYYGLYLRGRYYFEQPKDYQHGKGLAQVSRLLQHALFLLDKSLDQRPGGRIGPQELDAFLRALEKADLLPMDRKRLEKILSLACDRFFPDGDNAGGISLGNLASFRENYDYLAEGLRALEGLFRTKLGDEFLTHEGLSERDALSLNEAQLLRFTTLRNKLSQQAVIDLRKNISEVHTVFSGDGAIVFVPQFDGRQLHSYQHLRRVHYMRAISRLLLRTYGGRTTMSGPQLQQMLTDLDPVLKMFDANGAELAASVPARLFEASLFLPNSDGQEDLTMPEALEFEALLLSTWEMEPKAYADIASGCRELPDSKGEKGIEQSCFRRRFATSITQYWSHAPGLAEAFNQLGLEERINLLQRMDQFVRKGRGQEPFTSFDTKAILLISYYIEYLYARFDLNKDGWLDQNEARTAYPVFQPFLSKKASELDFKKPEEHYKIYTYILARQKLPQTLGEKLDFLGWDKDGEFRVKRIDIVNIFATLLGL